VAAVARGDGGRFASWGLDGLGCVLVCFVLGSFGGCCYKLDNRPEGGIS